jgi:hypothetical protein
MNYTTFLDRVIDEGIEAAKRDYREKPDKLKGAVEGFEACRGKSTPELGALLVLSRKKSEEARDSRATNYWEVRCFEAEVEWVCNVISSAMQNQGLPTIITPTVRGYAKAASILGVSGNLQERSPG